MDTVQLDVSTQWIEILATLVALAWTFFKGSALYKEYTEKWQWDRDNKVTSAIEAAVTQVYQDYVRGKKETSAFDADAKKAAHQMAVDLALSKLKTQGITAVTQDAVTAGVVRAVSSLSK